MTRINGKEISANHAKDAKAGEMGRWGIIEVIHFIARRQNSSAKQIFARRDEFRR